MAADTATRNGSLVTTAFVVPCVLTALAMLFVVLRLAQRFVLSKNSGFDDWVILAAMVSAILQAAMQLSNAHISDGRPINYQTVPELIEAGHYLYFSLVFYNVSLGLVKISILLQYLRLFQDKTRMRWFLYSLLALTCAYTIAATCTAIWNCSPIAFSWDRGLAALGPVSCLDAASVWYANAALNIFTEMAIIIAPLPIINSLNLPKRQKIGLIVVFGLGFLTIIAAGLRLHAVYAVTVSRIGTDASLTSNGLLASLYSITEVNVGIICACLFVLRPIISRMFPSLGLGRTTRAYNSAWSRGSELTSFDTTGHQQLAVLAHVGGTKDGEKLGGEGGLRGIHNPSGQFVGPYVYNLEEKTYALHGRPDTFHAVGLYANAIVDADTYGDEGRTGTMVRGKSGTLIPGDAGEVRVVTISHSRSQSRAKREAGVWEAEAEMV